MKSFSIIVEKKINKFNKSIFVEGDKSISHRALLISSQAYGVSKLKGINAPSEDILNTINALKRLRVRIIKNKNGCHGIHMWSDHWPGEAGVPCTHETCNRGNEKLKLNNDNK